MKTNKETIKKIDKAIGGLIDQILEKKDRYGINSNSKEEIKALADLVEIRSKLI